MLHSAVSTVPWLLLAVPQLANALCECGYSVNKTSDGQHALFTDLMENDFLHASNDNFTAVGWHRQEYNVSAKEARGPYGKQMLAENVEMNPLKSSSAWSGDSEKGGDAGLQLWVRGDHSKGFVSGAEVTSVRNDSLHGSFRVGMKMSAETGTCGAFFWYYNNSQEIDMEFLSKQFNQSQGAVNLVLQTPMSVTHGYDASNTSEFKVQPLPFRPDEMFHEYRFDWTENKVQFYVDGEFLYEMTENIPSEPGAMFFNHWSNGDPLWSAGPPAEDTAMTISYLKSYFNSTDPERTKAYKQRCPTFDASKVCQIPAQTSPPDASQGNDGAKTFFFSMQDPDQAPGQITYNNAASGFSSRSVSICIPFVVALLTWALAL